MSRTINHEVDFNKLRECIDEACGDRSYRQYSRDCGYSPNFLCRIVHKDWRPGLEIICKLAKASNSYKAGYKEFMEAAGYGDLYLDIRNQILTQQDSQVKEVEYESN